MKNKIDLTNFEVKPISLYEFENEDFLEQRRALQQKVIKDNVVKMLNDQVKGGRRDKQ